MRGGEVTACAFAPDMTRLASACSDETLKLWDARSGQELATLSGHSDAVTGCTFAPDARRLASVSSDGTLRLWDAVRGEELGRFPLDTGCQTIAWSPDGMHLAANTATGGLHILTLENLARIPAVATAFTHLPTERKRSSGDSTIPHVGCWRCRQWFAVEAAQLGREVLCPRCGARLRLNSFTIDADWRSIARAWAGASRDG
jgi:WD40 repeat protein